MKTLLLALLLALASAEAGKKASTAEEVDHVALAALLIRDGNWDRAADALTEVDLEALSATYAEVRGRHVRAAEERRVRAMRGRGG